MQEEASRYKMPVAVKGLNSHEINPVCFICSLYFSPNYLPVHLKTDHSKEELAHHLSLVYLDEWVEELQAIVEELSR